MMDPFQEARDALARAHDSLETAEAELAADGVPSVERIDLVVVWSVGGHDEAGDWGETKGWSATAGPKWAHAALLNAAAEAQWKGAVAVDDDDDE